MNIPHLPIYLGSIIKLDQKNLNLSYGAKMTTRMKLNGYQVASQGLRKFIQENINVIQENISA
jgi:hypothetical protein